MRRFVPAAPAVTAVILTVFVAAACTESPAAPQAASRTAAEAPIAQGGMPGSPAASFTFTGGPVFDIDAAPNGNVLVAETVLDGVASGPTTIWEIVTRGRGGTSELVQFSTPGGITPVNGLATVGRGSFFAARGGLDLAENAAVLHVTPAGARVVGDVEAFEKAEDPDLTGSAAWKDGACAAASGPFTPGPQSNPFHLAAVSGSTVLLADAAGNTLLRVGKDGDVELVALFTPPADGGGASDDPTDWLEFPFEPADDGFCFVQPVPNSVAVGPDGGIYVGELTGVGALGVSRVWRIAPGATDVVCPSADCTVAFSDFTSIIDLAFGPDGDLHVVEYDEAGWLTSVGVGTPEGGTVNRCDVEAGSCEIATIGDEVLEELTFPAALTFDRTGGAWLLENNLAAPTVRKLN